MVYAGAALLLLSLICFLKTREANNYDGDYFEEFDRPVAKVATVVFLVAGAILIIASST